MSSEDSEVQATVIPESLPWASLPEEVAKLLAQQVAEQMKIESVEPPPGERSELRIFTENGAYRGFWYAIESPNVLYLLRIYSEHIRVSPELEDLLRAKLALAAD